MAEAHPLITNTIKNMNSPSKIKYAYFFISLEGENIGSGLGSVTKDNKNKILKWIITNFLKSQKSFQKANNEINKK